MLTVTECLCAVLFGLQSWVLHNAGNQHFSLRPGVQYTGHRDAPIAGAAVGLHLV